MQYWPVLFETPGTVCLWLINKMLLSTCNTKLLLTKHKSTATKIITLYNHKYLVGSLSLSRSAHSGGTNKGCDCTGTARTLAANHSTVNV